MSRSHRRSVGIHVLDKNLEQHVREALRFTAFPVAGKDAVEVFPVLINPGHGAIFKTGAVGQRDKDDAAVQC